jgi:hypothetical protein
LTRTRCLPLGECRGSETTEGDGHGGGPHFGSGLTIDNAADLFENKA